MRSLFRYEIDKLLRCPRRWTGPIAIAGINALFALAFYLRRRRPQGRTDGLDPELFASLFNALQYTQMILAPAMFMLFPILAAVLAAQSLGGETESGALRMTLCRPVRRRDVILAKFGALSVYMMLVTALLLLVSYLASAGWLAPTGTVAIFGPMVMLPGGLAVFEPSVAIQRLLLSYALAWPMPLALAAMALMFAALTRRLAATIVWTTTVYFCGYIAQGLPVLSAVHPYLPTRYLPFWRYTLAAEIAWNTLARDAMWTGLFSAAFLAVACAVFANRDV